MTLCLACADDNLKSFGIDKWTFWKREYTLVQCKSCSTVFTNPLPEDEVLSRIYKEYYDYRWFEDHYQAKYIDSKIRLQEYERILGKRVLDFGGGVGYFSKAAIAAGYDSKTYDPILHPGEQVEGKWDSIVLLHVLEHSNNPQKIIVQIKTMLEPGGTVIIAVPNSLSIGYKQLGMNWVWAQPPLVHISHFTAQGLRKLLANHGFKDIEVSFHERWDANIFTDYENVEVTRKRDSRWGKPFLNQFTWYRRSVAAMNSYLRFKGLKVAMKDYDHLNESYSELQVTARVEF